MFEELKGVWRAGNADCRLSLVSGCPEVGARANKHTDAHTRRSSASVFVEYSYLVLHYAHTATLHMAIYPLYQLAMDRRIVSPGVR
jgi:hypothetical protein